MLSGDDTTAREEVEGRNDSRRVLEAREVIARFEAREKAGVEQRRETQERKDNVIVKRKTPP
jgi:hypothetical protein